MQQGFSVFAPISTNTNQVNSLKFMYDIDRETDNLQLIFLSTKYSGLGLELSQIANVTWHDLACKMEPESTFESSYLMIYV